MEVVSGGDCAVEVLGSGSDEAVDGGGESVVIVSLGGSLVVESIGLGDSINNARRVCGSSAGYAAL